MQSKQLSKQLTKGQSKHQHRRTQSYTPIIICKQKHPWNEQEVPDQNICNNTANELVDMEQYSPIPEDGKHQPRKWQCSRRQMDQHPIGDRLDSIRLVAKVQRQDVEEIENQHHFTPEEMFLRKQDGPQERKHVEHSKVPAHMACSIHPHGRVHVRDKDLHNKTDLQDI